MQIIYERVYYRKGKIYGRYIGRTNNMYKRQGRHHKEAFKGSNLPNHIAIRKYPSKTRVVARYGDGIDIGKIEGRFIQLAISKGLCFNALGNVEGQRFIKKVKDCRAYFIENYLPRFPRGYFHLTKMYLFYDVLQGKAEYSCEENEEYFWRYVRENNVMRNSSRAYFYDKILYFIQKYKKITNEYIFKDIVITEDFVKGIMDRFFNKEWNKKAFVDYCLEEGFPGQILETEVDINIFLKKFGLRMRPVWNNGIRAKRLVLDVKPPRGRIVGTKMGPYRKKGSVGAGVMKCKNTSGVIV